ncbi:putative membrane protein [Escherichia coli 2860650]|nr:putative membrane protein [Escherichia coli 2860650]
MFIIINISNAIIINVIYLFRRNILALIFFVKVLLFLWELGFTYCKDANYGKTK